MGFMVRVCPPGPDLGEAQSMGRWFRKVAGVLGTRKGEVTPYKARRVAGRRPPLQAALPAVCRWRMEACLCGPGEWPSSC